MKLHIDYLCQCMPGQRLAGDAAISRQEDDWALFAVIDGLGHGDKAHDAASAALESLGEASPDDSIEEIMRRLDGALRPTRGAAATVCTVRDGELSGCGVGNVEIRSRSTDIPWVLTPGILGRGVPKLRLFGGPVSVRSRVLLFTDGISGRFSLTELDLMHSARACEALMRSHARATDDATVMVVDFGG